MYYYIHTHERLRLHSCPSANLGHIVVQVLLLLFGDLVQPPLGTVVGQIIIAATQKAKQLANVGQQTCNVSAFVGCADTLQPTTTILVQGRGGKERGREGGEGRKGEGRGGERRGGRRGEEMEGKGGKERERDGRGREGRGREGGEGGEGKRGKGGEGRGRQGKEGRGGEVREGRGGQGNRGKGGKGEEELFSQARE